VRLGTQQARFRAGSAERGASGAIGPASFVRRPATAAATTRGAASGTISALFSQAPTALLTQPGEITTANGTASPS
jgi:hypothetical protein